MHLSSTKLVFPWTLGQISNNSDHSGVFQTYQWIPGPFFTTMIIIVMLVFTLMSAVCSVCYHVYYWASSKDVDSAVRNKDLNLQGPPPAKNQQNACAGPWASRWAKSICYAIYAKRTNKLHR